MSYLFRDTVLPAAKMVRAQADKLLHGVTPEIFARLASNASGTIANNHAAFCYGHLGLYPYRYIETLSLDLFDLSDEYKQLFIAGSECRDDPKGTIYPSMDIIVSNFRSGYDAFLNKLETLDDNDVAGLNPNEKMRERFPTFASSLNLFSTVHVAMHLGQVSAWRRTHGLPAL